MATNMEMSKEGNQLVIKINLPETEQEWEDLPLSKSGKSKLIASSKGNVSFEGLKVGLNVYKVLN